MKLAGVFIILLQGNILGGNLNFDHLTLEDGLSASWVKDIIIDSRGYLWFATYDGLNKYNGYEFIIYRNSDSDSNSISNNNITALFIDSKKRFWIGTEGGGVNLYNYERDIFISIPLNTDSTNNLSWNIECLNEDNFGNIWVGTHGGLFCISGETFDIKKSFVNEQSENSLISNHIKSLEVDRNGQMWVGTMEGLCSFNLESQLFYRGYKTLKGQTLNSTYILRSYQDIDGKIWFSGGSGIIIYDPDNGQFTEFSSRVPGAGYFNKYNILDLNGDGDNLIYIATENGGLGIYDKKLNTLEVHKNDIDEQKGINSNSIHSLYYSENSGTLYIGTYDKGINILNKYNQGFKNYPVATGKLNNPNVMAILEDKHGKIWIGTDGGGINVLNRRTGEYIYLINKNKPPEAKLDIILDLYQDAQSLMWIGTYQEGLFYYDPENDTYKRFERDKYGNALLSYCSVHDIEGLSENNILIGTNIGAFLFDKKKNVLTRLNELNITYIEKSDEKIWFGTLGGVAEAKIVSTEGGILLESSSKYLANRLINCLLYDKNNTLWIGTTRGLFVKKSQSDSILQYTISDGLPDNKISEILYHKNNDIWISTGRGISKFINGLNLPDSPEFKNYYMQDGLQGLEFKAGSGFQSKSGEIFFGSNNGLNSFYPEDIFENPVHPEIVFTDLKLFNTSVLPGDPNSPLNKSFSETDTLSLNHKQSVITIEFAALNFIHPEQNQYAYILEGFEEQWNNSGNQRSATYTNLDPGEYVFMVKASNNSGIWNEKGRKLVLQIMPPFWMTLWFKLTIIFSFFMLYAMFYMIRVNQLRKNQEKLEELVTQRTSELYKMNEELNEVNTQLEERQQRIEQQSEELRVQAEQLHMQNERLLEQKVEIIAQREELGSLNSMKDKFFSIIAHDLKNPFNSIIGFSELLKFKGENIAMEKRQQYIDNIYQSAVQTYKLLENLLQWSRSQIGSITFNPEIIDLGELVNDIINLVKPGADKKSIRLSNEVNKSTLIYADRNMLNTVLRNLLTNAIKYTDNGGINVHHNSSDREDVIEIQDTGVGMEPDETDRLFALDQPLTKKGTQGESGTGLGLIICKEFIERHGGKIWVKSKKGEGTNFSFSLPKNNGNNPS